MTLLDTDVCIGILHANPLVIEHLKASSGPLAVPGMVVGELYYGVEKSDWREHNLERTEKLLVSLPVYHPDTETMRIFGRLKAQQERNGTPVADADTIIAATALSFGASLATGNIRHFSRFAELKVENWFAWT